MANYLGIVPAFGRDYKSKKALVQDWEEGKDFIISDFMHPYSGKYVNNESVKSMSPLILTARYDRKRKVCTIEVNA